MAEFKFKEIKKCFAEVETLISVDAKSEKEAIKKLQKYYENNVSINDMDDMDDILNIDSDEWIEDLVPIEMNDNKPTIIVEILNQHKNNGQIIYQNIK